MHLDRVYDSEATRERLQERGLLAEISEKGKPAPVSATKRWVMEQTNSSWHKTPIRSWCGARSAGVGSHEVLGGLLRRGDRRERTHPGSLEPLPLGGSTFSSTVTYCRKLLSALEA